MTWINKQPRMTQVFCVAVSQLNDVGIYPGGCEIKQWIRQQIEDEGVTADRQELAQVLTGMIAEKAITQSDVNRLMAANNAKPIPVC